MARSFKELKNKMSPKAQAAVQHKVKEMLVEMPLYELRQAKYLSQERLAEILHTKQANISRIERRTDMYVSTLRSYIEAMGGELDIIATFPEGSIHISLLKTQ
ncbi:MAG: XRE family transcriptional regulator [Gammaproteobacteria bacterium]|nr:XRE family transcriptional regulator [Gammaproteobacteria bacterium]